MDGPTKTTSKKKPSGIVMTKVYNRILVTGGAGFIGSHIVEKLIEKDFEVSVLDNLSFGKMKNLENVQDEENFHFIKGDIRDSAIVKNALEDIDVVFHEAALTSVILSVQDPITTNDVNVNGTLNLLRASVDLDVKRFIFASSAAVYGEDSAPMKHENMYVAPQNPYGVTKLAAESYVKAFTKAYGLESVSFRYFNVYGPRQSFDLSSGYGGVVTIFANRLMKNLPLTVYGDGEQTRDFVSVDDIVQANMLALSTSNGLGDVFNIGSGNRVTVNQVANILKQLLGKTQIESKYEPARVGECRHGYADITKAKITLGFEPVFLFDEGIKKLIKWYSTAYNP